MPARIALIGVLVLTAMAADDRVRAFGFDPEVFLDQPAPETRAPHDPLLFSEIVTWIRNSTESGLGYRVLTHYLDLYEDEPGRSIAYTTGYLGFLETGTREENRLNLRRMAGALDAVADPSTRRNRLTTALEFAFAIGDATVARRLSSDFAGLADEEHLVQRGRRFIAAAELLDATAPPLRRQSADGRTIDLRDYRGAPVVIDFWASWCAPCKDEFPHLRRIHRLLGDRIRVLGVSLDDEPDDMAKMVREHHLDYPQVWFPGSLDSPVARQWEVPYLPWIALVDAEGRVIRMGLANRLLLREVERLIGEPLPPEMWGFEIEE